MMMKALVAASIYLLASSLFVEIALADSADKNRELGRPFQELLMKIQRLEDRVDDLADENAELKEKLACVSGDSDGYDIYIEGCNLHVRNGVGQTDSINNLGNLIIGYNEDNIGTSNDRSGSHNLVVGSEHTYSSYGGFVAGSRNTISGVFASVCGGEANKARGDFSSVTGGGDNIAAHLLTHIGGGFFNQAIDQPYASVSGGGANLARGFMSHIAGGYDNEIHRGFASVCGGQENVANALYSSILGGRGQITTSDYQTIPPIP